MDRATRPPRSSAGRGGPAERTRSRRRAGRRSRGPSRTRSSSAARREQPRCPSRSWNPPLTGVAPVPSQGRLRLRLEAGVPKELPVVVFGQEHALERSGTCSLVVSIADARSSRPSCSTDPRAPPRPSRRPRAPTAGLTLNAGTTNIMSFPRCGARSGARRNKAREGRGRPGLPRLARAARARVAGRSRRRRASPSSGAPATGAAAATGAAKAPTSAARTSQRRAEYDERRRILPTGDPHDASWSPSGWYSVGCRTRSAHGPIVPGCGRVPWRRGCGNAEHVARSAGRRCPSRAGSMSSTTTRASCGRWIGSSAPRALSVGTFTSAQEFLAADRNEARPACCSISGCPW